MLRKTGPAVLVRWYATQGSRVGRKWRRHVSMPIADRIPSSTEAGPKHFGLWRWSPGGHLFDKVSVDSAGASSTYTVWRTSPWEPAAPWFSEEKAQEKVMSIAERAHQEVTSFENRLDRLVAVLAAESPAGAKEKMGEPDMPLMHALLDAAAQVQRTAPASPPPPVSAVPVPHIPDQRSEFEAAIEHIEAQLQPNQIRKRDVRRSYWNHHVEGDDPEIHLGVRFLNVECDSL